MKISLVMCISRILTDLCALIKSVLIINGKQSVKLKSGSISFKNYFKQINVPFKIYTDFECLLKESKAVIKKIFHTPKNIKIIFLQFGV